MSSPTQLGRWILTMWQGLNRLHDNEATPPTDESKATGTWSSFVRQISCLKQDETERKVEFLRKI